MKKLLSSAANYAKRTDVVLILMCMAASGLSVLFLYSIANSNLGPVVGCYRRQFIVQAGASAIGIIGAIIISLIDYHFMAKMWKLYVPAALFMVVLTFFIGIQVDETIDDKAWIRLPFGLTLQPSELMKIAFILSFALHLARVADEISRPTNVLMLCLHAAVPMLLVRMQGDDGTLCVFLFIFLAMIFAAGIDWKYVVGGITAAALALPLVWQYALSDDQRSRFLSVYFSEYADPLGNDYQQRLSRISIGSGQVFGKGLFQDEYWYVPKVHNDFIFSFVGQAMGFVGALLVVALLAAICIKTWRTSMTAVDPLGSYICVGVFAMIFFQVLLNIGMCVSLLPVIGITLPFFSAGGTSVVITYMGVGLVLSVYNHSRKTLFYQ